MTMFEIYRGVVQLVESRSPKPLVLGSSPSAPAKKSVHASVRIFYFFTLHSSLFTKSACTDFLEGNK